jgi:hypothetical protein
MFARPTGWVTSAPPIQMDPTGRGGNGSTGTARGRLSVQVAPGPIGQHRVSAMGQWVSSQSTMSANVGPSGGVTPGATPATTLCRPSDARCGKRPFGTPAARPTRRPGSRRPEGEWISEGGRARRWPLGLSAAVGETLSRNPEFSRNTCHSRLPGPPATTTMTEARAGSDASADAVITPLLGGHPPCSIGRSRVHGGSARPQQSWH